MNELNNYLAFTSHLGPMMNDDKIQSYKNENKICLDFLSNEKNICILYGNCQCRHLEYILNKSESFSKYFTTIYYANFEFINSKIILNNDIINNLKNCSLFIYQPVSDKHDIYSTVNGIKNNIISYLNDKCFKVSFPYINNIAISTFLYEALEINLNNIKINFFKDEEYLYKNNLKLYIFYKYFGFKHIIDLKNQNLSDNEIINKFDNNLLDFNFNERFNYTINRLQEYEKNTDIEISQYILDNYKNYELFFTNNHPTNYIFVYIANKIFEMISLEKIILSNNWQNLDIRQTLYDKYNCDFFKFTFINNIDNNNTKNKLIECLSIINNHI